MSRPKHAARKLIGPENTVERNSNLAKFGELVDTPQRERIFGLVAQCCRVARYNKRGRKSRVKQRNRMLLERLAEELPAILWDDLLNLRENAFQDFIEIIQATRENGEYPVHWLDATIAAEALAILCDDDLHWKGDVFTGFSLRTVLVPITFPEFLDRLSRRAEPDDLDESTVRKRAKALGLLFRDILTAE